MILLRALHFSEMTFVPSSRPVAVQRGMAVDLWE